MGIVYEGDKHISDSKYPLRRVDYFQSDDKPIVKNYELLQTLDFDPKRKRMSVIVRDLTTREYVLFCKGADNAVMSICSDADLDRNNMDSIDEVKQKNQIAVDNFAQHGWRTLVLAYRILKREEYEEYETLINKANNDILNREEESEQVYRKFESNLTLIGATAVEDKLQERVEQTLCDLRKAGIKIWVLTGDKVEVKT
jgi:phospholipid-translocating ATPase